MMINHFEKNCQRDNLNEKIIRQQQHESATKQKNKQRANLLAKSGPRSNGGITFSKAFTALLAVSAATNSQTFLQQGGTALVGNSTPTFSDYSTLTALSCINQFSLIDADPGEIPRIFYREAPRMPLALPGIINEALTAFQAVTHFVVRSGAKVADLLTLSDLRLFPGAEASPHRRQEVTALAVPNLASAEPDVIKTKLDDLDCVESRASLTFGKVLRKIADTLEHPVTEMSRESQVLIYLEKENICPTQKEIDELISIARQVDQAIAYVQGLLPGFGPVVTLQQLVAPILRLIADELDEVPINPDDIAELGNDISFFAKNMVDLAPLAEEGARVQENIAIPVELFMDKGNFFITIEGEFLNLIYHNNKFYVYRQNGKHEVIYKGKGEGWHFVEKQPENTREIPEDIFFKTCTLRRKRGKGANTSCGTIINNEGTVEDAPTSSRDELSRATEGRKMHPLASLYHRLLQQISIPLGKNSPVVDKIMFNDRYPLYRIRAEGSELQVPYHAIEISGKLVPARAKDIYDHHIHCEVYRLNHPNIGYPVIYNSKGWQFELPTSQHVSRQLKMITSEEMYAKDISSEELSIPDAKGLKRDINGLTYLKINNRHVKVVKTEGQPFITSVNHDRYYIVFKNNKFDCDWIVLKKDKHSLTPQQYMNDLKIKSEDGYKFPWQSNAIKLNEDWSLMSIFLKSTAYEDTQTIGTKIDVILKMKYGRNSWLEFQEPPDLQWKEQIRCKDGSQLWEFSADMHQHNQRSPTFFPWQNRYLEAYHYAKAQDKADFHGNVRIFTESMEPLSPLTLPTVSSQEEKISAVKSYLKDNGGILEINISDLPQVRIRDKNINKERVVNFNIGFNDRSYAKFNQAISVVNGVPEHVFVTTSENINLAQGAVNVEAPIYVSRKRGLRRRHVHNIR